MLSIPERWKLIIKEDYESVTIFTIHCPHLIKGSRVVTVDKLTSSKIYSMLYIPILISKL